MPTHPYYPPTAEIPNYIPNDKRTFELVSIFALTCSIILTITYTFKGGFIHLFLEGNYTLNFLTLTATFWKDYALSDPPLPNPQQLRPLHGDHQRFYLGPGLLSPRLPHFSDHDLRCSVQGTVSLGQLYGDVLYYANAGFESVVFGIEYSRSEGGYLWGYFVFLNAFWVVVPFGRLLWESVVICARAIGDVKVRDGREENVVGI
ncbi:Emopamil binding protein-domain-containing protein [Aspergillus transmontanensis]|uniref:Emopamil binding protein-domain-containing protein n=1 Tax=Aspergillus transmontanensis TaxID=1034304 RepID=A0A5N6WCW8_9EURO|nr:Emopamil binding protein-domain-containing protein [Aspergillus transmontanensis]